MFKYLKYALWLLTENSKSLDLPRIKFAGVCFITNNWKILYWIPKGSNKARTRRGLASEKLSVLVRIYLRNMDTKIFKKARSIAELDQKIWFFEKFYHKTPLKTCVHKIRRTRAFLWNYFVSKPLKYPPKPQ